MGTVKVPFANGHFCYFIFASAMLFFLKNMASPFNHILLSVFLGFIPIALGHRFFFSRERGTFKLPRLLAKLGNKKNLVFTGGVIAYLGFSFGLAKFLRPLGIEHSFLEPFHETIYWHFVLWVPLYEEVFFRWYFYDRVVPVSQQQQQNTGALSKATRLYWGVLFFWLAHLPADPIFVLNFIKIHHFLPLPLSPLFLGFTCSVIYNLPGFTVFHTIIIHAAANAAAHIWNPLLQWCILELRSLM